MGAARQGRDRPSLRALVPGPRGAPPDATPSVVAGMMADAIVCERGPCLQNSGPSMEIFPISAPHRANSLETSLGRSRARVQNSRVAQRGVFERPTGIDFGATTACAGYAAERINAKSGGRRSDRFKQRDSTHHPCHQRYHDAAKELDRPMQTADAPRFLVAVAYK